ncbi:MAG: hypothetical protein K8T91_07310, partial [Planctomycetes bacterium]|nr:hypothetical protein [Planctomycetota bacterium]
REDGSELALRVFNRGVDARREAYLARSRYVEQRQISSLVPFSFDEKGVRASDGKLYPLLTMDWVPGVTLFEWVRDRCHEGYAEALAIAADVWLYVVRELAENGIVHGDLQHGNVLVSPEGHFKLVDYDCLAVPELMGQPNLELGLAPYQHPRRDANTRLFPGLDNYSALMIYVALRALAAAPQLWATHVDSISYDRLLFRTEDFEQPEASALYRDLLESPDAQVRDLTYYLFQLRQYELEDVPAIDEVLLWCNSLEDLLARKDWDTAVQLADRMSDQEPIAPALQPQVEQARRRIAARTALEHAMRLGNEWAVQKAYDPQLLDDYPAAAELVEEARRAVQVIPILETLNTARRFAKWDVLRDVWNANQELLSRRVSARPYRDEVRKIWGADSVARLLADPQASDQAVVDAWAYLESLGGHPIGAPYAEAVHQRQLRLAATQELKQWIDRAPATPTLSGDRQLVAAWRHSGLEGWAGAEAVTAPCRAALARIDGLRRVRQLSQGTSAQGEREIVRLAEQLPADYHPDLARRSQRARKRLESLAALSAALKKPRSELAIVEAWRKVVRAKAERLVSEAVRKRVRLARRRAPLITALSAIDVRIDDGAMDRRLLELWDERLLAQCYDARGWLPRYQLAQERRGLLEQVAAAAAETNKPRLTELFANPKLRGYPLDETLSRAVNAVDERLQQRRLAHRQELVRALAEGQPARFVELFDAQLVREICRDQPRHQTVAQRWTEAEILPLVRGQLTLPGQSGLTKDGQTVYHARWQWPEDRLARCCEVAVCRELPRASATPADTEAVYRSTVTRTDEELGNRPAESPAEKIEQVEHVLVIPPEWSPSVVVVWGMVDLGFQMLYTEAVELGRIEPPAKKARWGFR